jgi:hypothetical protein
MDLPSKKTRPAATGTGVSQSTLTPNDSPIPSAAQIPPPPKSCGSCAAWATDASRALGECSAHPAVFPPSHEFGRRWPPTGSNDWCLAHQPRVTTA